MKPLYLAPDVLEDLVAHIEEDQLKVKRSPGKWISMKMLYTLAEAQKMMLGRFRTFKEILNPEFKPYLPGTEEALMIL